MSLEEGYLCGEGTLNFFCYAWLMQFGQTAVTTLFVDDFLNPLSRDLSAHKELGTSRKIWNLGRIVLARHRSHYIFDLLKTSAQQLKAKSTGRSMERRSSHHVFLFLGDAVDSEWRANCCQWLEN